MIDLLVDRWAARIEALNYCVPVREFSPDDTKKLCWAALEIGKLVEREISYRANRAGEPTGKRNDVVVAHPADHDAS